MNAITVKNVEKSFGKLKVLKGINLTVQQGEIFTLLGENGAGKSTLINILATLSMADTGSVEIAGMQIGKMDNQIRKIISLNAQTSTLDEEFTGYENLKLILKLRGYRNVDFEIEQIANQLDLKTFLNRKVETYSGGMRRRLDLAMSLIGNPNIIFLDEPTTGVDPKNRLELWNRIEQMRTAGKTVFLTTQYLEEADRLSDHIAFMHDGQIVRYGTPQDIKRATKVTYTIEVNEIDESTVETIFNQNGLIYSKTKSKFTLDKNSAQKGLNFLLEQSVKILNYHLNEMDLETVFISMTEKVVE